MLETIIQTIKENQTLLAAFGLGSAGLLTFWLKDVPALILRLFKREFTTSLTVTNCNSAYYNILLWISTRYKNKNFRYLKLTNGRWGDDKQSTLSIGFGTHFIRYKSNFWVIQLVKDETNQAYQDKEYITITKIGRSKKVFDAFLEEIKEFQDDVTSTKVYRFNDNWEYVRSQNKRTLDTIFIEKNKKDALTQRLTDFITKENWYVKNGIPYQLGILLYGPPGTGKTSLIKAISSYLNYPIYNIQTSKMLKIEEAFEALSEKCVVVVEDIDCQNATHSREKETAQENVQPMLIPGKNGDIFAAIGLSEILNALDGVCSTDGRILIATTNHIEKLDAALLRPGRFDLKIKVDYVTAETFVQFMGKFYPGVDVSKIVVKDEITIATLQELLISGVTSEQMIAFVEQK